MKTSYILTAITIVVICAFGTWQYRLHQKLSNPPISCGGDFTYNVKCEFGSSCKSLDQGQLAGGYCKAWLSGIFRDETEKETNYVSPTLPNIKPTAASTNSIISSEVLTDDSCRVKITTSEKDVLVETGYAEHGTEARCYQFLRNTVSSTGKYAAIQDLSGGVDSMVRVYSAKYDQTLRVGFFGTSEIFDFLFTPDDKLVVLNGYKDSYAEQFLSIYDVDQLFSEYPNNVDMQYMLFTNTESATKVITLADIGKNYASLVLKGGKVYVYGTQGTNGNHDASVDLEDL